jgi:hypothetical protein
MALPWLSIIDTLIDVTNLALSKKSRTPSENLESAGVQARGAGTVESRMTGVVVAALKEAFDRDAHRLELEREQMERERMRAERLLKLDLLRQAGDREIGRLRLLAAMAVGSWFGTLYFSSRLAGGPIGPRVLIGVGWLFLLVALSLSFKAQSRLGRALATLDDPTTHQEDRGAAMMGAAVPWLIVSGLAAIGVAMLLA